MNGCASNGYESPRKPDFHWWREGPKGYVGRPPSPFPASFEHTKKYREESAVPTLGRVECGQEKNGGTKDLTVMCMLDEEPDRKLYWPLFQGPDLNDNGTEEIKDCYDVPMSSDGNKKAKKSPRQPGKRPAWRHVTQPNKYGISRVPPPYTNHCKETLFDTKNAHPMKLNTGRLMILS